MSKTVVNEAEDRAAILEVVHRTSTAFWEQDFEAYSECFVHADYLTRWHASRHAGIFRRLGWNDISARVRRTFEDPRMRVEPYAHGAKYENLQLQISQDMAWVTFDLIRPTVEEAHFYFGGVSHEFRVLEKHNGTWLVAFWGVMHGVVGRRETPILHLAADGRVTWQSPAAVAALEADDDFVIRNGRAGFRDARADKKLKDALRWAIGRDTAWAPERETLPIVIEAGEGLPAKVYWVFAEGGLILLSLHIPGIDARRLDVAALIFALSPTQKQIAGLVVEGLSLLEIAERMKITTNTARTHLNRVFEKTGVRTRPALVRVLLSSAPPV